MPTASGQSCSEWNDVHCANFYARDILAVRCTQQGCAHRRSIFEVASDPHAMFLLPTTPTPLGGHWNGLLVSIHEEVTNGSDPLSVRPAGAIWL